MSKLAEIIKPNTGRKKAAIIILTLTAIAPALGVAGFFDDLFVAVSRLWLSLLAVIGGGIAGALYVPDKANGWKGLLSGMASGFSILWVTIVYASFRDSIYGLELLIPLILGVAPGAVLFYILMKQEL
jgi:hypothetical protein